MKAIFLRLAYALGFGAASFWMALHLGMLISNSSFWMPEWLWNAVAAVVKASDIRGLYNEDDVETLCMICLLIACWAMVALVLGVAWMLLARSIKKRRW
jgi:uncharacterized membrane protein